VHNFNSHPIGACCMLSGRIQAFIPQKRAQTSIVRVTLCTSVLQGAEHFCTPSHLLSTTITCFSKLIAYIVWCSSCGQNLIQFATHCCPAASTVRVACTFAEPHSSLPKNGRDHYHDLLKHCIQTSHVNTKVLYCFMGGWPALDTFSRFTCPQIIPHNYSCPW
jgi:hypothetical protein